MNGHDEFLELIAASIDFELTDEEFGRLSTHLSRCPECRRAADEIRGGAADIAALPAPTLAPARAEQILRAAMRTPPAKPRWGMLAVAAMLATLGGGVLFAGFQLIQDDDSTQPEPAPSLIAEASAPPSAEPGGEESADPDATPKGGPPATPNPGDPTSTPANAGSGEVDFPVPFRRDIEATQIAPAPDNRLWVTLQRERETLIANLDAAGEGKPWIEPWVDGCTPHAVDDGSVRILCHYDDAEDPDSCPDVCGEWRVYAFNSAGEPLANFPVSLPSGETPILSKPRVVGRDLVLAITDYGEDGYGEFGSARTVTIGPDGIVREGARIPAPMRCCKVGPDGTVFGTSLPSTDDGPSTTQVFAFDAHGARPGWPIILAGHFAGPSFSPTGEIALAGWSDEDGRSQIVRLHPDGTQAADPIEIDGSIQDSPEEDGPATALVDERGRTWVVADGAILGFDSAGQALAGFPYDPATALAREDTYCDTGVSECSSWPHPPTLAPRSLIYALEAGPAGKGERIAVINPDGSIRSGWPKTLQRDGATWDSLTIGDNRTAYAVAVEPEPGDETSTSILAFAPNGTQEWIRTLVEP